MLSLIHWNLDDTGLHRVGYKLNESPHATFSVTSNYPTYLPEIETHGLLSQINPD